MIEYKFISPLQADVLVMLTGDLYGVCNDELIKYEQAIKAACDSSITEDRGLAEYIWKKEGEIYEKVKDIRVTVEQINGKLMGVAYVTSEPLSAQGIEELKAYLTGQYSDGWGEGFEQRSVAEWYADTEYEEYDAGSGEYYTETTYTSHDLYVSFWYYERQGWKIELASQREI